MECEFFGCSNELDENEWQPEEGMKLCKCHADEFDRLIEVQDNTGIMRFASAAYYGGYGFDGLCEDKK
jgi:hypothetical protein